MNDSVNIYAYIGNNRYKTQIPVFYLSIATLENAPQTVNDYKITLKRVDRAEGRYYNEFYKITKGEFINQPALLYENKNSYDYDYMMQVDIKFIRNDVLFNISRDPREASLACQVLSTFKFIR